MSTVQFGEHAIPNRRITFNPKGWKVSTVGDVTTCLDRMRRPVKEVDRVPGDVPYYGANGQQGWMNKALFDEPLVLVAEDGGHFDDPARGVAYRIDGPAWVNNHAHVLRPSDAVDIEYLHRALRHYDFTQYISGSTRAKLNQKQLNRAKLLVPPLVEQKRIAGILDTAEALRAKGREALGQLDALRQSTFLDMFGDPVANPMGWEKRELSHLCGFRSGHAWKAKSFNSDRIGSPVIRIQNVGTGSSDLIHTTESPIERFWVEQGEFLLSLSGSFRLVAWNGPPALLNQRIVKLTPESIVAPAYFGSALSAQLTAIEAMGRHALVNNVALSDLRKVELCLPPLDLQHRFAAVVESVEQQKTLQRTHLAELDTLFASLQSRSFQGNL